MSALKRLRRNIYLWFNRKVFRVFESHEPELFVMVMAICVFTKTVSSETRMGRYLLNRYHGLPAEDRDVERLLFVVSEPSSTVLQRNLMVAAMVRLGDIQPIDTSDDDDGIAVSYFFEWMGWGALVERAAYYVTHPKTTN